MLATNSLPLHMNQKRRCMDVHTRCPLCFRLNEDGGHVFLKCKLVKQIWRQLQMGETREKLCEASNAMILLETILNLEEEGKLTCCMLWIWWAERNKANLGKTIRKPQQIVSSVISRTMEHKALGKNELKQKRHLQSKWTLPMNSFVKINTNGAFRESSRSRGWGFISKGLDLLCNLKL
jgi:hypothetical protein